MAKIVVLGAGIGGISQVYELRQTLGKDHQVVLIGDSDRFEFTPSNPWVAVGWRKEGQICVDLPDLMKKHGIDFHGIGAKRLHPDDNKVELTDGSEVNYDYLVIATGPKLAFEEVPGLGPDGGFTQSSARPVMRTRLASTSRSSWPGAREGLPAPQGARAERASRPGRFFACFPRRLPRVTYTTGLRVSRSPRIWWSWISTPPEPPGATKCR